MPETAYFPAFLRLDGSRVLLVGGGGVALRKLWLLRRSGARVEIVARDLHPELAALAASGAIVHVGTEFAAEQLDGCRYAVAATDDAALNGAVAEAAGMRGIYVNVVDDVLRSTAITPSIVDRTPLTIAISSGGAAPVLVRRLREQIEALLPGNLGALARFISQARETLKGKLSVGARRTAWELFLDGPGAEAVLSGDMARGEAALHALTQQPAQNGEVYLVGAGPGDPDLLTLRALRLMQQADVVLYDRLLSQGVLDLVRRDAERVFVGKRRNQHTVPQGEINAELVRRARAGQRVLRLKGGDPFVFGRGGEEIETLAAHGIPFQVVPGISAANGCAAYAGIPLTHRDYAQACVFVAGHPRADGSLLLPWESLVQPRQTVVIYMGLGSLEALCNSLIAHGLPADWPAALVEEGTRATQRVIAATLQTLPRQVAEAGIAGASLVIVGEVVRLRERLKWFGSAAVSA